MGLIGGVVSWVATNFVGHQVTRFYRLKGEFHSSLTLYANVSPVYERDNPREPPDWDRFIEAHGTGSPRRAWRDGSVTFQSADLSVEKGIHQAPQNCADAPFAFLDARGAPKTGSDVRYWLLAVLTSPDTKCPLNPCRLNRSMQHTR